MSTFDAMGIQIVSPELELDLDDDLGMDMDDGIGNEEEEELIDPVELAAEYNLDDPGPDVSQGDRPGAPADGGGRAGSGPPRLRGRQGRRRTS